MGHPARADLIAALAPRVPLAPIVLDRGGGEWDTGRRALLAFDPDSDWHVVIQDDAIVPARFGEALNLVLGYAPPRQPVGLYYGRCRPAARLTFKAHRAAVQAGSPWIEGLGPWWGVAVAIPTEHVPALVAFGDDHRHSLYDVKLTRYFRQAGILCRYPVPSLVDHPPELESVLGSMRGNRCAYSYLGEQDPAAIDWTRPPVTIDHRSRITVPAAA